eukprot:TRINITY_DN2835_c0_g1_i1.p1 TRINITY_DN2835_c0_g1~~TRINITY_DN2835_c0_g1_i1.p1  ORF type:complete len:193 (-),score=45.03 TRINITY_DN2835_c0_g1_i1:840-1418(-)
MWMIIDVGGQRSERKKWLNCFSSVDAVLFLMAMDEYDRMLEESDDENRLVESLKVWNRLTSLEEFRNVPFILFMNKKDLFRKKIETIPMNSIFKEDYEQFTRTECKDSMDEYEKGKQYILKQFERHHGGKGLFSSAYDTCALDSDNCIKIFNTIQRTLLDRALCSYGIKQWYQRRVRGRGDFACQSQNHRNN